MEQTTCGNGAASANQVTVADELQTLGKDIVGRIERGDKAKADAEFHYKEAGPQLIKAQERVGRNFRDFLEKHCNGLQKSRAYDLIKIAKGETTTKEVRAKTNARTKRHRAKKKVEAASAKVSATQRTEKALAEVRVVNDKVVSATQRTQPEKALPSPSEKALAQFRVAVDTWLPQMDAETKQKALAYVQAKVQAGR